MRTTLLRFFATALLALHQPVGWAEAAYPNRSVRVVVPFAAGGGTDAVARLISEKLSAIYGQTFIVDNKPGAAGIIGTDHVAKAKGDGYTLLMGLSNSLLTNQFLYSKLPYSPSRDLALIYQLGTGPLVLTVHPSVPHSSSRAFLDHIRANSGKLNYGSYGAGTYSHLAGEQVSRMADANMTHVPYKGEAPLIQDLLGGSVQMGFVSALAAKAYFESGRLKPIGVSGLSRMAVLPNIPTLQEAGFEGDIFDIVGWLALAAPASTPKAVQEELARQIALIMKTPDFKNRMLGFGFQPIESSPELFRKQYNKELPVWEKLIRELDVKLD